MQTRQFRGGIRLFEGWFSCQQSVDNRRVEQGVAVDALVAEIVTGFNRGHPNVGKDGLKEGPAGSHSERRERESLW